MHHLRGRTSKTVVYARPSFAQSVSKEAGQRSGGRTATAASLLWIGRHRRPNPGKRQSHQGIERYFGPSSPPACRPASGGRRRYERLPLRPPPYEAAANDVACDSPQHRRRSSSHGCFTCMRPRITAQADRVTRLGPGRPSWRAERTSRPGQRPASVRQSRSRRITGPGTLRNTAA